MALHEQSGCLYDVYTFISYLYLYMKIVKKNLPLVLSDRLRSNQDRHSEI